MAGDQQMKPCTIVLHSNALSSEDILCGAKVLQPGQCAHLSGGPTTKTLCIRASTPATNPDEISVHVSVAERFGFENRMNATVRLINNVESATATHVELLFRDQHLSRADMWQMKAQLEEKVLWCGHELKYMGSTAATVKSIYISGANVDSAFVSHPRTKCIFRSASARYTILIQISAEMLEHWSNGSLMYEHLVQGFLTELFARWHRLKAKHFVSIVLFGRQVPSSPSINSGATEDNGSASSNPLDFFQVIAVDFASSDASQLLYRLRAAFEDVSLPRQVCLASQGNMLEAIHLAAMDFADENLDPPLGSNGTAIIAITAGAGLFEADFKLLTRTTEILQGTSVGVDIVSLAPKPLHPVPLFRYVRGTVTEYSLPHWLDISFWPYHRAGMSSKWLMPNASCEVKHIALPYMDSDTAASSLDSYDEKVFSFASGSPGESKRPSLGNIAGSLPKISQSARPHVIQKQDVRFEHVPPPPTSKLKIPVEDFPFPRTSASSHASKPATDRGQRGGLPPHPLMQNNRKISLGPRGLAPSQSRASTTISAQHAQQEKDFPMDTLPTASVPSSGLAQHLRESIKRRSSQQSIITTPATEASPASRPINIPASHTEHNEESPDPALVVEQAVLHKSVRQSAPDSENHTPNATSGSMTPSLEQMVDNVGGSKTPWLTLLNPCNPRPNNMWIASEYRKWQNVYPTSVSSAAFKWSSMCTPASLPLITETRISRVNLERNFDTRVRRLVAVKGPNPKTSAAHQAMVQLVATRLAAGFQIVPLRRITQAQMPSENIEQMFLSLGNIYHELRAMSDYEVQVTEWYRREEPQNPDKPNAADVIPLHYHCLTRPVGTKFSRQSAIDMNLRHPVTDWSPLDDQSINPTTLAEGFGVSHMRFVLIPVEPPRLSMQATSKGRELSDEERHLEGIQRLTQLWQKHRFFTDEEQQQQASMVKPKTAGTVDRDPNPLAIEYQTRDLSAILSAYGPSVAGEHHNGEETKLFAESETYHSSNFDVSRLVAHMQEESPNGVELRDRRWFTRLHLKCFRGDEMTNWLLRVFKDLETREDAVALGNQLMDRNVFTHVRGRHAFKDGNYFFQLLPAYRTSDYPDTAGLFAKSMGRTVPSTPRADIQQSPALRPMPTDYEFVRKPSPTPKITAVDYKVKKTVMMSQKLQYNVDPGRKSRVLEIINLHYDRLHSPMNCYHIQLDYTCTTAKLIRESVGRWSTLAEGHGLKLVQLPLREACKSLDLHPLDRVMTVKLAIRPPEKMLATPHMDPQGIMARPHEDKDGYHKAILRKLDFFLDFEARQSFPEHLDIKFSWGDLDYSYTQFVHASGLLLAQISNDRKSDFLLFPNRLALNTGFGGTKRLEHCSLEAIVKSVKAFCRDRHALTAFFADLNKPKTVPSPFSQWTSNTDADVPPIELPPRIARH